MIRRGLRLELAAGLGIALSMPALAFAGQSAQGMATEVTLQQELHEQGSRTQANMSVTVDGADGLPATGPVVISDHGRQLAGAALNKQGQATLVLDLLPGDHSFTASYLGDATHRSSISDSVGSDSAGAEAAASTTPDFQISIAPASLSLGLGQSGTIITTITPVNSSALTTPMFITLSCSGLPDQSSCTFNPENLEILPNATAAVTSSAVFVTQQQEGLIARPHSNGIALAILLPGALGLGGLAWSVRRRRWLRRLSLLGLVALVTVLGTTACNPQYDFYNHGPPVNPSTPPGTYTVNVTAQSSNGVTATTHSTTLAFTVQ
jgi:hypothetical protein